MTTEYPPILKHPQPAPYMKPIQVSPAFRSLGDVLRTHGLPKRALVFGVASEDGLPVTLSLGNYRIPSILIVGDTGCGKTVLLQSIAVSATRLKSPSDDIGVVVITDYRDEWENVSADHIRVIAPSETALTMLGRIAESGRRPNTDILVLIDSPRAVLKLSAAANNAFKAILQKGIQAGMRMIMTTHTNELFSFNSVLNQFHMRIYGHVRGNTHLPGVPDGSELHTLRHGQFTLRKSSRWLRFDACAISERM